MPPTRSASAAGGSGRPRKSTPPPTTRNERRPRTRPGAAGRRSRPPGPRWWGRCAQLGSVGRPLLGKSCECASLASTTSRVEALKRGLQVVSVR